MKKHNVYLPYRRRPAVPIHTFMFVLGVVMFVLFCAAAG